MVAMDARFSAHGPELPGSALCFQRGLCEGIELRDRGAGNSKYPPPAASKSHPVFERGNTFGAEALEEWQRQFRRQPVRHAQQVFGNRRTCQAGVNITSRPATGSVTRFAVGAFRRQGSAGPKSGLLCLHLPDRRPLGKEGRVLRHRRPSAMHGPASLGQPTADDVQIEIHRTDLLAQHVGSE